jgi:hypothetical protein
MPLVFGQNPFARNVEPEEVRLARYRAQSSASSSDMLHLRFAGRIGIRIRWWRS